MNHGDLLWVNSLYKTTIQWGVFLDRDGVVIEDTHLMHDMKDYRLIPQAVEAIRILNGKNIPVVLATNQTVVARGLAEEDFIVKTHACLQEDLLKGGAHLDAIAACLHSPRADIETYRLDCDWRKPKTGMFTESAEKLKLDLRSSWGIGDKMRDVLAYQNAGMHDILVRTGHGGEDCLHDAKPTVIKKDILEAVEYILKTTQNSNIKTQN